MDELAGDIILVEPSYDDKQAISEYCDEFLMSGEKPHGSGDIECADSFEVWLQACVDGKHEDTMPVGRVPATQFLAKRVADGRLIGMIQVRHALNAQLKQHGGHIGYSVRKSERGNGYATSMLQSALDYCKELGIKEALLTCNSDNIASASVIMKNGGVFARQIMLEDEGKLDQYWIRLD